MKALWLAVLAVPQAVAAQALNLSAVADTVFQRLNTTHSPGCVVGVERDGKRLLERAYGMADLESGRALTFESILESGSVAKQFTATAALLLARDGKLDLDDPVRKYIPELAEYDRPITIRHLLTHTSGLREWSALVAEQGWPRGRRAYAQADLLEVVYRQKALNYPVGDYYSYTNSGYAIAMSLVERLSGKSFQEFTRERIFEPLGMTHTQWRDDFTRLVPGRAQAYEPAGGGWRLFMPFENVVGPGGLLTTAGDWLLWNRALVNKTLGAGVVDSLTRRMRLTGGREIKYALGVFVDEYRGLREVWHTGGTAGYATYLGRYPDRGQLSVAVLCNGAGINAGNYAHQIVDRVVTDFPAAAPLDTTRVDSVAFMRYAGQYRDTRTHTLFNVGGDAVARVRALPGGWYWLPNGTRWHFASAPNSGRMLHMALPDNDTLSLNLVATETWKPTVTDLQAFVGSYTSTEIATTYQARLLGDTLVISARVDVDRRLRPAFPDAFNDDGEAVWFTRDSKGRVTAMHFGAGRMWDLVLNRQ